MSEVSEQVSKTVVLSRLVRDPNLQVRQKLDPGAISRYAETYKAGNKMPPITVALVDGVPILIDGWHRVAALEQVGERSAEAIVIETTAKEARWLAAEANLKHGVQLKKAELREVFRAYVKTGKHKLSKTEYKSYRDMNKDLNIPVSTLHNWMRKDFKHIAAKIGGDENFKGKGGLPDRCDPSSIQASAMRSLQEAYEAFRSTADPEVRGQIIERMDHLIGDMKRAGNWDQPDF